jgi:hypothetical protein
MKLKIDDDYRVLQTIHYGERLLPDGTKVRTEATTDDCLCIATYEAGTTGPRGGDTGYGARTYLRFQNDASTDFRIYVDGKQIEADKLEIILGGDQEINVIRGALSFMLGVLDEQIKTKKPSVFS